MENPLKKKIKDQYRIALCIVIAWFFSITIQLSQWDAVVTPNINYTGLSGDDTETNPTPVVDEAVKKSKIESLKKKMNISYDEFEQVNWIKSKNDPKYIDTNRVSFYFWKTELWTMVPRFVIRYAGDDRLFIKNYVFLIDWIPYWYTPDWDVNRDNKYWGVWEYIDEPVDWNIEIIIEKIISAKTVKIKYNWDQYSTTRTMSDKEKQWIKDTFELYQLLSK